MEKYIETFVDNFINGIPNLLTALGIFLLSLYFARVLSRVIMRV